MSQYCNECTWAGQTSGQEIYCNYHQEWVSKWSSCSYWKYYKTCKPMRRFSLFLTLILSWLGF